MNDKSTTKNKYDFFQTPDWAGLDAYKAWAPEADPTIPYQFAKQRRDLESSFINPMGAYTTPEMQREMMKAGQGELAQVEGQAMRAGQYDVNQLRGQQLGNIASLSAPKFAQTQAETKSRPGLLSLLNSAVSGASAAAGKMAGGS